MVNNISWGSYWSVLAILTILYYAYILLVYYGSELRNRLAGKSSVLPARHFKSSSPLARHDHHVGGADELLPVMQSLTDEVSAYLEQAAYSKAGKPEVLFALQQMVKRYPVICNTSYQESINKLLQFEAENKCAIHLNEVEIKQVWMG